MFYMPNPYRPVGQISDYSYCPVMKAKSINFYVKDVPLALDEAVKLNKLLLSLPVGLPHGVRTRVWKDFFKDVAFLGEFVSYSVYNELGEAVEVMFPYENFVMADVPWEDLVA